MSTSEFMNATASKKADILLDGLSHLQSEVNKLKANLTVFNQWMGVYPDLVQHNYAERLGENHFTIRFEELKKAYDALHDQFIILDLRQKTTLNQIVYELPKQA